MSMFDVSINEKEENKQFEGKTNPKKKYCSRIIISKGVFLSETYFVCVNLLNLKQPNAEVCVQKWVIEIKKLKLN